MSLEFIITIKLTYPELGEAYSSCQVSCHPDGGTPLAVTMDAAALLIGSVLHVAELAGLDRDVTLDIMLQKMATARTVSAAGKVEGGGK